MGDANPGTKHGHGKKMEKYLHLYDYNVANLVLNERYQLVLSFEIFGNLY